MVWEVVAPNPTAPRHPTPSHPTKCIVGIQVLPGFPFSLRPSCMSAFLLSLSYVFLSVDAEIAFGRWRFCIPSLATQCSWMVDTFVSLALLPWDNLQVSMSIGSSHCSFFSLIYRLSLSSQHRLGGFCKVLLTPTICVLLRASFHFSRLDCELLLESGARSRSRSLPESLLRTRSRSRSRDCLIDSETFVWICDIICLCRGELACTIGNNLCRYRL